MRKICIRNSDHMLFRLPLIFALNEKENKKEEEPCCHKNQVFICGKKLQISNLKKWDPSAGPPLNRPLSGQKKCRLTYGTACKEHLIFKLNQNKLHYTYVKTIFLVICFTEKLGHYEEAT